MDLILVAVISLGAIVMICISVYLVEVAESKSKV